MQTPTNEESEYLQTWLTQFFPENTLGEILNILKKHQIHLKIKNPRKSVLGTYIPPHNRNYHIITMNSDLNKYQFLKTFLHEYAHLLVQINYHSGTIHGIEWKNTFRQILYYFIKKNLFPNDITLALLHDMIKMYAKSSFELYSVLRSYGTSDYECGKIDFCCCFSK